MISFCDIPLSRITNHNKVYGKYGIGMSMEWANANGLNPILYLHKNSLLSLSILTIGDSIMEADKQYNDDKNLEKSFDAYYQVFQYVKNYRGSYYTKDGSSIDNYKYYDEREWRYVVPTSDENMMVKKEEYDNWRGDSKNKPLLTEYNLQIRAKDIKYIIVEKDDEIHTVIDWIGKTELLAPSELEKQDLISRITSLQQIIEDF